MPHRSPDPLTEEATDVMSDWLSGTRIGKYVLVAPLTKGGMAELWLARQKGPTGFERVVAVKRILSMDDHDGSLLTMFLDEARIAAQLSHPNIVQTLELVQHQSSYFIAMEYIHGDSLSMLVRRCLKNGVALPIPFGVHIVAEAATGLGYAHARRGLKGEPLGIVHRDVSPQNIMVTYDGLVKVVDFGIAKASARSTHTKAGTVKGKMAYMAPEQPRGSTIDARADVFALGAVLFEVVTGSRLYGDKDEPEILRSLLSDEPLPDARERNSSVPEWLAEIIAQALLKSPEGRPTDGTAFAQLLNNGAREQQMLAPSPTELSQLVREVLSQRIEAREKLLTLEPDPLAPQVPAPPSSSPSAHTMPGRTPAEIRLRPDVKVIPPEPRSLLTVAMAMVALVLVLVGAALFFSSNSRRSAPPLDHAHPNEPEVPAIAPRSETGPLQRTPNRVEPPASTAKSTEGSSATQPTNPQKSNQPTRPTAAQTPVGTRQRSESGTRVGTGTLTLDTEPWTEVYFESRPLGDTPLIDLPLPAGLHRLRVRNEDAKIDQEIEVRIKPSQKTSMRLRL